MADDHRRYLGRREAKSEEGRIEPPAAEDGVAPVKPPDPPAGQVVPAKSRPWLPGGWQSSWQAGPVRWSAGR